ncbi:hypothetical protein AB0J74_01710 [Asanoa sp. NPDC049573]|uniref:AMIN-like domain-containing (lipo)protein n=1 Tax=Asanoa sp. NPDC049573 TaxID=3155396 RepID=UPI0034481AEF
MRRFFVPLLALIALGVAACEPGATAGGIGTAAPTPATASGAATTTAAPAATKRGAYRVSYGWAVPSRPARVAHRVDVPVQPPPAAPLPFLATVEVGDHPGDEPPYTRMTFAFEGAWPSYEIAYERSLTQDGTGDPVPLPGNSVLRITFTGAQAHDDQGRTTARPETKLGFPTLKGYAVAGDFEGQVVYGLGIQAAPNSDQARPIRVGELIRADGTYVVAVDVRR